MISNLRRPRKIESIGVGVVAAALVLAQLVVGASSAQAADVTVLNSTFDDGSYDPWVVNGTATLSVVPDPSGTGQSLEVSGRTQGYDGIALDLTSLLTRDVSYSISFRARLADDTQPAGGVHFTVDDGSYTWVSSGPTLSADEWTTVSGAYTLATGAAPGKMYLDAAGDTLPDVLLDDITIVGPAGGGGCTPTEPTDLIHVDFSDSTLGGLEGSGASTTTFEDVDGNPAVRINGRDTDFAGLQTAAGALASVVPGSTIQVSAKVRLAGDTAATTSGRLVMKPNYNWIGNQSGISSTAWTTIGGSYTVAADAVPADLQAYIGTDALSDASSTYDYFVDDFTITLPGEDCGGSCTPTDPTNLLAVDFDDSTLGGLEGSGSSTTSFEEVDGNVAARISNRSADYEGLQTAAGALSSVAPGSTLQITAKLRIATATDATTSARMVVKPNYDWVGNQSGISAAAWTTIGGSYTVAADADPTALQVYIGTAELSDASGPYDYFVDDFTVTIAGDDCGGGGPSCEYPTADTLISTDFESGLDGWAGRDDGNGVATLAIVDGGHESDHALSVTEREGQGQGIGHDVTCLLEPGTSYQFDGWVRFADGQPVDDVWLSLAATTGTSTAFSTLGQFTGISNTDWTHISGRFQVAANDSALLYLETRYDGGATGNTSDLLFDDLVVTKPAPPVVQDITPLKSTVPFHMGVAIDSRETSGPASQLLLKHFDQITPENFMKPEAWYDADGNFVTTNAEADALMTFAAANGIHVYGHTLVWHSQTPDWFFQDDEGNWLTDDPADQAILRQRLHDHIFNVAQYLSDKYGAFGSATNPLYAFDVVNEVISDGTTDPDGMRQSRWYQVLGESFIDDAFADANEAFNDTYAADGVTHPVRLFINDYNTEQAGKQARYHALVERLLGRGAPVDGVGHQFHLNLATPVDTLGAAFEAFQDLPVVQAVTELDVPTGTPVTQAKLIDQGYFYKAVFDTLRAYADDLFAVTVWGLTDGRSWRDDQGDPLLFDDDLQAKPAYYGASDQELPAKQRSATVFQGDVPLGAGATESPEWTYLPLLTIDGETAFQLRWAPDHLTAYVHVSDASVDAGDGLAFAYGAGGASTLSVPRSGADPTVATVTETAAGYDAVVHLPLDPAVSAGSTLPFDVTVTDGATTAGWNSPGVLGTLSLVEQLSFVEIPEAAADPVIDGAVDAGLWDDAATVETSKQVAGSGGATAQVHTLWRGDTLYVLADVSDPTVDVSASDPWQQDSLEVFVDAGNAKNGAYRPEDSQIRISAENVLSFGTGDEAAQLARVTTETSLNDHGYFVEAAITLLGHGGEGTFQGLDFQVNDGTAGARTAIHTWADPTGNGYQTTARWGVGELVAASGPVEVAPVVTTDPVSQTVADGASALFTAAATGTPEPTVQWQSKPAGSSTWSDIAGAESVSLTVTAGVATDGTSYRAVFTNPAGSATTEAATLTVQRTLPVITTHPTSVTVDRGATATFVAGATGYPAPSVAWQRQLRNSPTWVPIHGAHATTLRVTATSGVDGARYRAVFTNSVGSRTTQAATLTVRKVKPVVTTHPRSTAQPFGSTASFTAFASGYPTPDVSWQRLLPGGRGWATISGAHATTLKVVVTEAVDGARYRAVFSNAVGAATSNAATLTAARGKPVILTQPESETVRVGQVAAFRVEAVGKPAVSYRWYVQAPGAHTWKPVAGGTSSTLRFVATWPLNGTEVRVVVSNAEGSVTSSTATLTVRR